MSWQRSKNFIARSRSTRESCLFENAYSAIAFVESKYPWLTIFLCSSWHLVLYLSPTRAALYASLYLYAFENAEAWLTCARATPHASVRTRTRSWRFESAVTTTAIMIALAATNKYTTRLRMPIPMRHDHVALPKRCPAKKNKHRNDRSAKNADSVPPFSGQPPAAQSCGDAIQERG